MMTPVLSVVITAQNSADAERAFDSLEFATTGSSLVEIIVVTDPQRSIPQLRWAGLNQARGRAVVFLEGSCVAQKGWVAAWLDAFQNRPDLEAASGLVAHNDADASTLDRAIVFFEYAPFLSPVGSNRPARLAGNHFAVRRDLGLLHSVDNALHEVPLLDQLNGRVEFVEKAVVEHVERSTLRRGLSERLTLAREFGCLRRSRMPAWKQRLGWVALPLIFAIQTWKVSGEVLRRPGYRWRFGAALPLTLLIIAAWSLGEWLGWSMGDSARRVDRQRETADRPPGRGLVPPRSTPSSCTPSPGSA